MCPTYTLAVLDPRITYEGLKLDFANDPELLTDLKRFKELLEEFYDNNYAASPVLLRPDLEVKTLSGILGHRYPKGGVEGCSTSVPSSDNRF